MGDTFLPEVPGRPAVGGFEAISLAELAAGLRCNWQGVEALRERLDHQLPRFGNDLPEVDAIAEFGRQTGATLDGRRAGEPFAASLGPVAGRDRQGLTAMLNSVAALPHELLPTSTVVNVTLDPDWVNTRDGADTVAAVIIAHFLSGGQQLQFTVADGRILREAQQDPARYDSLMVRVAGYSARFTSLDKSVQDEILARTINQKGNKS